MINKITKIIALAIAPLALMSQIAFGADPQTQEPPDHSSSYNTGEWPENTHDASLPNQIAVLLPESGTYSEPAKLIRQGIMNAYYKNTAHAEFQNIKFYNTAKMDATAAYQLAIDEGADVVIGPLEKNQVLQLSKQDDDKIPTLALNYTDADDGSLTNSFYEFGLLPEDEAIQMAATAYQAGTQNALIISPNTDWGKRMSTAFVTHWQSLGGDVVDKLQYSDKTNLRDGIASLLKIDINQDKKLMKEKSKRDVLEKQRRQDFDVVIVFAPSTEARAIVPMLRYYYVRNVPIYATSTILAQSSTPGRDTDFDRVTVCYMPAAKSHDSSKNPLYHLGEDAYQLSQILKKLNDAPNSTVHGSTGTLVLRTNHQIRRRLPCHAIKNGHIQTS